MPNEFQVHSKSTIEAASNFLFQLEKLSEQNRQLITQNRQLANQNAQLSEELLKLKEHSTQQEHMNAWFRQQLFGKKSEKYLGLKELDFGAGAQLPLAGFGKTEVPKLQDKAEADTAISLTSKVEPNNKKALRGKKRRPESTITTEGLRFGPDVQVKEEIIIDPEIEKLPAGEWERIGFEVCHKLGQHKSYFVKKFLRTKYVVFGKKPEAGAQAEHNASEASKVLTEQATQSLVIENLSNTRARAIVTAKLPAVILKNCIADTSFLVGLVVDKFAYHLPLHRIYLRLKESGIEVSRTNLTNWIHEIGDLLYPIWGALSEHVLQALVLTMDETPVRTRLEESGQMKDGWFWGVYGEREFILKFATSREYRWVAELLGNYKGVLLSDGFGGYETHCDSVEGLIQAACWSHARRMFVRADGPEPKLAAEAALYFRNLYKFEQEIRDKKLLGKSKLDYRLTYSKPVAESFFSWLALQEKNSLPELDLIFIH